MRKLALSVLETPERIYFENIKTLKVEDSGPQGPQGTGLRQGRVSITLNRIQYVDIKTYLFSCWKEKTLNISITNVDHSCVIYGGAILSSSHNSTVKLANITGGRFFSGAFATTLGRLTLKNVTMSEVSSGCQNNTFSGPIGELSLTSVKFNGIKEGCFFADQTWGSLTVRSSRLGAIEKGGLRGRIGDVLIDGSKFSRIQKNGFDLNVTSLSMNASFINTLASHALNVRASGKISIVGTKIITIDDNAFRRLNSARVKGGTTLSNLTIDKVVNGSLRFSYLKSLALHQLKIRKPCKCNIRVQVEQLFFGGKSPNKKRRYRYAYENIWCLHNHTTASLREYHCSNCRRRLQATCASGNKNAETDKPPSTSSAPSWVLPVVVSLLCPLLLGAIFTLFVFHHRRRPVLRRRTFQTCQKITKADIQHPLPDLTHEAQRMDLQSPGEVPHTSAGSAMLDSPMYETVSGLGGGEDEALYEDVSTYGHAEGEMKGEHQPNTSHVQPLYTQVNKGKKKDVASSEYTVNSARLGDHPHVYAQVNKTKTKAGDLSGEGTHGAQNIGMRGSDTTAKVSETGPGDDTTSDLPVYAQVFKRMPGDKKPDECQSAGHPGVSSADPGDDMSSDLPVYAQVSIRGSPNPDTTPEPPMYAEVKRNETDGTIQAGLHGSSQQPWRSSEAPLYAEIPGLATDEHSLRSPESSSLISSRLYGYAVPY